MKEQLFEDEEEGKNMDIVVSSQAELDEIIQGSKDHFYHKL